MPRRPGKTLASVSVQGQSSNLVDGLARIDLDDLSGELEATGADALWWGILAARARRRANELKFSLDVLFGQLAKVERQAAAARSERITDQGVKEHVHSDPRYNALHQQWLDAEEAADIAESAKFTIARKQSTLEQMAGMIAQDIKASHPRPQRLPV